MGRAIRSAYLRGNGIPLLMRVGVPVDNLDPFKWLSSRRGPDRIIWQARHHNKIRAMCGTAAVISGDEIPDPNHLARELDGFLSRPGDDVRFFGGMRFDPGRTPDSNWEGFRGYRFVLPRFELHRRGPHIQMYCNLVFPEDSDRLDAILNEIDEHEVEEYAGSPEIPEPVKRSDYPNRENWSTRVQEALRLFLETPLEKVVLARRADFEFLKTIDPFILLEQLADATPNCFHFHFESEDGNAFIGATPERLFYRNGLQIESEAVAGTRPRGATKDDDDALRASLLTSDKDQREHAYVRDSIEAVLNAYCESVTVDQEASEMRLARGRHLVSRVTGVLSTPVSDFELVEKLHPTPAVGGHPTATAVSVIRDLERFDRGWYAGPVGWVGRDAAEFAVALRCGLVSGNQLSLFSGAGIVKGSEPDLEWQEIEQKIVDFVNVIGLDVTSSK